MTIQHQAYSGFRPLEAIGPDHLTNRELQVLVLITRGLSNQDIAETLFLSINSVKSYIRTAYRKIGATRRTQAVIWGARHGLLDQDVHATLDT